MMRTLRSVGSVAALLVLSSFPLLAQTLEAPAVIQAATDGSFESFGVVTASQDVVLGGYSIVGAGNVVAGLLVDCFCPPEPDAGCGVAAGETFEVAIGGNLIDPTSEGFVEVTVTSCEGPDLEALVRILPAGQCATDVDCDDGLFCNGVESCTPDTGECRAVGACSPVVDGCVVRDGTCSESGNQCQDLLDDTMCPGGQVCRPTGACEERLLVTLEAFFATVETGGVRLTWVTDAEIDNFGFRVFRVTERSKATAPRLEILTPQMIVARGGALSGDRYEYLDTTAPEIGTVQYYLQDVDLFGRATLHGPLEVERSTGRRSTARPPHR